MVQRRRYTEQFRSAAVKTDNKVNKKKQIFQELTQKADEVNTNLFSVNLNFEISQLCTANRIKISVSIQIFILLTKIFRKST